MSHDALIRAVVATHVHLCAHVSQESKELRLLIYDAAVGGTGLAWQAYQRVQELLAAAVELLLECPCTNGCPSCVYTSESGCYNEAVCKRSAAVVLSDLAERMGERRKTSVS